MLSLGILIILLMPLEGLSLSMNHEQWPLASEQPLQFGILRRFQLPPRELEIAQDIAQDANMDIWQITPDWLDVYFPPLSTQVAPCPESTIENKLLSYSHTSSLIPINAFPGENQSHEQPTDDVQSLNTTFHRSYHPLFEIDLFLDTLATEFSILTRKFEVGRSAQGRAIDALFISSGEVARHGGEKRTMVVMGPQHSREWVATSTALYIAHALLVPPDSQGSLYAILGDWDVYVIPVPNPDGYTYTWESDRFWYKNRMITDETQKCVGVDMNRNWGYQWSPDVKLQASNVNISASPCSHSFPGHYPFQAPEVDALASFLRGLKGFKVFLDLRSYGQMLSTPYSYSCKKLPGAAEDQIEAALGATSALRSIHQTPFVTGRLCNTFYRAHGNMIDWMYAKNHVKYSFVAHLRDTGTYGFALPPNLIRPVGEETAGMLSYLARFVAKRDG